MTKNKKPKIRQSKYNTTKGNINTELKEPDYDSRYGKLAFEKVCSNKCPITEWQGKELKLLIDCFKKIESLKWNDILKDIGLNFERNKNIAIPLPREIPKDVKLCSIRISEKMRIYGYRAQEFFYIIWFDKNHIVCPMNKRKKYSA